MTATTTTRAVQVTTSGETYTLTCDGFVVRTDSDNLVDVLTWLTTGEGICGEPDWTVTEDQITVAADNQVWVAEEPRPIGTLTYKKGEGYRVRSDNTATKALVDDYRDAISLLLLSQCGALA